MPFRSRKQMKFMYSQHPDLAKKWSAEAKREGKPQVQKSKKRERKASKGRKRG